MLDRILGRRGRERQVQLDEAVRGVDRELAANLELAGLFDQTRQAVVFENDAFSRHRTVLEDEVPDAFRALDDVYGRMTEAEAAMARRGPANSLRPEDRVLIETWEGDVRDAQSVLRAAATSAPRSLWRRVFARLRGGRKTER